MKPFKSRIVRVFIGLAAPVLGAQIIFNPIPARIVGQPVLQQQGILTMLAPNLVEGRELSHPQGVALDTSVNPPALYIADTGNNRVLAWKNAVTFKNGDFADRVIGQRDRFSTLPKGPGSDLTTGLSTPSAVVVDKDGNLYVADSGNNRVVRYPAPLKQTTELLAIDLIIGQKDLTGRQPNEGRTTANERTLAFTSGATAFSVGMAFDSQGNLWVSDPGNNRVLRFPASTLASGSSNEPAADFVVGQPDFTTTSGPRTQVDFQTSKKFVLEPAGIAFDPQGRLFVADSTNRILVFAPPFNAPVPAARVLGAIIQVQGQPPPPANTIGLTAFNGPVGIFFVGNNPYVLDSGDHRILKFDAFDAWPAETATTVSPAAIEVIGQGSATSFRPNQGQPQPSANSFFYPTAAVFSGTDLYLADTFNNRVLDIPQTGGKFINATRVLGQVDFKYNAVNLIEGREFFFGSGGSVVIDTKSDPPHLYVSDPGNNRVLGFKDARNVRAGMTADIVIGQPDFFTSELNYPTNDPLQVTDIGLAQPEGLALDSNGNLYVADTLNGRILRFPRPFDQPQTSLLRANLVIGQANFFQKLTDASSQTMRNPYGIAFTVAGHLAVSDPGLNRVLFFRKPTGGDFINGQPANNVIGQPDFQTGTAGILNGPRLIGTDTDDRLYVADTGNGRIAVFRNLPTAGDNPPVTLSLSTGTTTTDRLNSPTSVVINSNTGDVWVADANSGRVLRYPKYDVLILNPTANTVLPSPPVPLAVTLDAFGSPVVAEGSNRISFYYPIFDVTKSGNAANYAQRYSPGMLALIKPQANLSFGSQTITNDKVPIPTSLGDVQVLVNGTPAPLLYVSPGQINLQIPWGTPVGSQPVEIQVIRVSTSQVWQARWYASTRIHPACLRQMQAAAVRYQR